MKRNTDKFEVVERKIVSDRCVVLETTLADDPSSRVALSRKSS